MNPELAKHIQETHRNMAFLGGIRQLLDSFQGRVGRLDQAPTLSPSACEIAQGLVGSLDSARPPKGRPQ